MPSRPSDTDPLALFHPAVRTWFRASFPEPTPSQQHGWAAIAKGQSVLIQAPTGSGKTLAAFLWAIDRLMFEPVPPLRQRCRVVYVSPLKALAVDVDRNLRAPLAGIARLASIQGVSHIVPTVAIRTGDTPSRERARFQRAPADILITTPESLYLLLTSNARDALQSVVAIIIDEIHALVPTKRGAHLALSVERLQALSARPLQRVGLSATQRPLDEAARYLGGAELELLAEAEPDPLAVSYRPVTIIQAGGRKALDLRIEVPVADMARPARVVGVPGEPASQPPERQTIWSAIHPRVLELVRTHRSTLIFVNSRRVAERFAGALNDLAGEVLVRAHHGSIARDQRIEIEEALKAGNLRGLVATSSLELGIDMGAIDLVVQIEAPPSVASGLQRVGRGGHHVNATSHAVLFPKFRGDLLACAAVAQAMHEGLVESTRYPRNPLDVLAQHLVAMASVDRWHVDDLLARVRTAAPFVGLSRQAFDGVLDMLSGRYPSDEFAGLRPRVTWDRRTGTVVAREGARRVAVTSGGTVPDRGLYGVFLTGAVKSGARVGELDEEMVFESRVGETFVLGATAWRIDEITHDRVLVSPAPGEAGKMPFWKADAPGRPVEFGQRIGQLVRELRQIPVAAAVDRLVHTHDLDRQAAENLLGYLADQAAATHVVPDDRTIVIERCRDEGGAWRLCLLSPFGSRVHAPWAMAAVAHIRARLGLDVDTMWTDDGIVVRFPETEEAPDSRWLLPPASDIEHLVISQLGSTAYFAGRFREAAARALLLPRRRPGGRAPLWQQRKRAADLLAVASRFGSFPIVLESYRECLRDDFDMPALVDLARRLERRSVTVTTVDSETPSPFAASLLFGYVANYLYDGDAPLAERRAQALGIDQVHLRDLIGIVDLRELLDSEVLDALEHELQCLDANRRARSADSLHDLLLRLGDLTRDEIARRSESAEMADLVDGLMADTRVIEVVLGDDLRCVPVEYASRYRDALETALPPGLPDSFLQPVLAPLDDVALRYARTHGPFTTMEFAARYALSPTAADAVLRRLTAMEKIVEGDFRPGGARREWCAPDVLRQARRRSLAKLRHQVEPVEPAVLGRFLARWHGIGSERRGLDALLDVVDSLQGAPLPASLLESAILPARLRGYVPGDLDTLAAAGEVSWRGLEPIGQRDGRLALYLTDAFPRLVRLSSVNACPPQAGAADAPPTHEAAILTFLAREGASYFGPVHEAAGGGYPADTVGALWSLVWQGLVTNDTFQALREYVRPAERSRRPAPRTSAFRSRRLAPPAAEGRWSLVAARLEPPVAPTEWATAVAEQLLARYGVLTREVAASEAVPGGFGAIYPVLRALEDRGRIRRGYFVAGVAATQFAGPAALDMLRELRSPPDTADVVILAATDPASPYGALLRWPTAAREEDLAAGGFARTVGASVVLVNGALAAFVRSASADVTVLLPDAEPERSVTGRAVAAHLSELALAGEGRRGGLLVATVNGRPAAAHPFARYLHDAGFTPSSMGYYVRRTSHYRSPSSQRKE